MSGFITVLEGGQPLMLSVPHAGTEIPADIEEGLVDPALARRDTDWWIDRLYAFAETLGASIVRTDVSRSVIDLNRDPSGRSLYPGQNTTALCPTETFDGEPLYRPGREPDREEIERRRRLYFDPYHTAVTELLDRTTRRHGRCVLYDCHSIRSVIPRLFEGELPHMNIGTNSGRSCDSSLQRAIESLCDASRFSHVSNGRFKGGWITRTYGRPEIGVHAVQMELACRSYMREPPGPLTAETWPAPYDENFAAPMRETLQRILEACLDFAWSSRET